MSESDVLKKVRSFLIENFLYMRRNIVLHDDDSLLRNGVMSSLDVVELVDWVETTFGVKVGPSEITEQNFETPRRIARFVSSKTTLAVSA